MFRGDGKSVGKYELNDKIPLIHYSATQYSYGEEGDA